MKIGDLFVALGIQSDKKSFDKAKDDLGRFTKQADGKLSKLSTALSNVWNGGQQGRNGKGHFTGKGGGLKGLLGKKAGTAKGVAGLLGVGSLGALANPTAIAAAAGAGLTIAAKDALDFDDSLQRLDISSRGAMGSLEKVKARVLGVSRATGVAKEELVEGTAAFVALTGDGKMAAESMETFAKVAKGTNSPMADVVGAAAALNEQLGLGSKDFERAFSILIEGGKAGKIELKDMASLTASLAASYKQFGASQGIGGVATLGSAFQIVAKNFGSASEAATGLDAYMGSILQNAKDLKKIGINPYEEDGKTLRSIEAITADIQSKDLNATKVLGLLKRKEAVKTYNALADNRKAWEDIRTATLKSNAAQADYDKYSRTASAQIKAGWNDIKVSIAEAFTPEVIGAFVLAIKDALSFVKDLARGLGVVGDLIEEISGGDDAKITKQEQDDALDNALLKGKSLADIEALLQPASNPVEGMMRQNEFMGLTGSGDTEGVRKAIARRRAANKSVAKRDEQKATARYQASPTLMEQEAASAVFDATAPVVSDEAVKGGSGTRSTTVTAPVSVTINAPGADGKVIEGHVRRALADHRDTMARELDAAAGGE